MAKTVFVEVGNLDWNNSVYQVRNCAVGWNVHVWRLYSLVFCFTP